MSSSPLIDQITDRVERLLVRQAELLRTQTLLRQQLQALTQERDSLKSRLAAARARVDALIDRLPGGDDTPIATPAPAHKEHDA